MFSNLWTITHSTLIYVVRKDLCTQLYVHLVAKNRQRKPIRNLRIYSIWHLIGSRQRYTEALNAVLATPVSSKYACTQRNLFEILLNQTEIRLYLSCTDWFGTKRSVRLVPNKSMRGKYNIISVWFNKISKRFPCVCLTILRQVRMKGVPALVHRPNNFKQIHNKMSISIVLNICVIIHLNNWFNCYGSHILYCCTVILYEDISVSKYICSIGLYSSFINELLLHTQKLIGKVRNWTEYDCNYFLNDNF